MPTTITELLERHNGLPNGHRQGYLMYEFWTEEQARAFATALTFSNPNREVWVEDKPALSKHWNVCSRQKGTKK